VRRHNRAGGSGGIGEEAAAGMELGRECCGVGEGETERLRIWVGQGVVAELGKEAGGGVGEGVGQGAAAELGIGRRRMRVWRGVELVREGSGFG